MRRAVDGRHIEREADRVDLNDMKAGNKSLEMIAAIFVGDGVGAVLKHHTDALNTLCLARVNRTATIGDAANERESFANTVANDADNRVHCTTGGTAIICCRGKVESVAGACVLPNFSKIGEQARSATGQRGQGNGEAAAIRRNGRNYTNSLVTNAIWT